MSLQAQPGDSDTQGTQYRIERGAAALGTDGTSLGTVEQIVVDQASGALRALVIRGADSGAEFELPANHIQGASGESVQLDITASDLQNNPQLSAPYNPDGYVPVSAGAAISAEHAADAAHDADEPVITEIESDAAEIVLPPENGTHSIHQTVPLLPKTPPPATTAPVTPQAAEAAVAPSADASASVAPVPILGMSASQPEPARANETRVEPLPNASPAHVVVPLPNASPKQQTAPLPSVTPPPPPDTGVSTSASVLPPLPPEDVVDSATTPPPASATAKPAPPTPPAASPAPPPRESHAYTEPPPATSAINVPLLLGIAAGFALAGALVLVQRRRRTRSSRMRDLKQAAAQLADGAARPVREAARQYRWFSRGLTAGRASAKVSDAATITAPLLASRALSAATRSGSAATRAITAMWASARQSLPVRTSNNARPEKRPCASASTTHLVVEAPDTSNEPVAVIADRDTLNRLDDQARVRIAR